MTKGPAKSTPQWANHCDDVPSLASGRGTMICSPLCLLPTLQTLHSRFLRLIYFLPLTIQYVCRNSASVKFTPRLWWTWLWMWAVTTFEMWCFFQSVIWQGVWHRKVDWTFLVSHRHYDSITVHKWHQSSKRTVCQDTSSSSHGCQFLWKALSVNFSNPVHLRVTDFFRFKDFFQWVVLLVSGLLAFLMFCSFTFRNESQDPGWNS